MACIGKLVEYNSYTYIYGHMRSEYCYEVLKLKKVLSQSSQDNLFDNTIHSLLSLNQQHFASSISFYTADPKTLKRSICLQAYLGASLIKASLPKSSPLLSVATVPLPCITTSTDPLSIIYHERPSSP
uniref:Uncharacterized protein n=1 Tax=Glossina austeni TaxID=7395 RepID=A0A1A9VI15_GLOAU